RGADRRLARLPATHTLRITLRDGVFSGFWTVDRCRSVLTGAVRSACSAARFYRRFRVSAARSLRLERRRRGAVSCAYLRTSHDRRRFVARRGKHRAERCVRLSRPIVLLGQRQLVLWTGRCEPARSSALGQPLFLPLVVRTQLADTTAGGREAAPGPDRVRDSKRRERRSPRNAHRL